jgi:hypothetical protein
MTGPLIISPKGGLPENLVSREDQTALSLKYRHFDNRIGRVRVIGSWWLYNKQSDPCLVILNPRLGLRKQKPGVVRMSTSWIFAEPPIGDFIESMVICTNIADGIGFDINKDADLWAIHGAIRDRLYDLQHMPPAPKDMDKVLIGDVRFRTEAGDLIERDFFHHG